MLQERRPTNVAFWIDKRTDVPFVVWVYDHLQMRDEQPTRPLMKNEKECEDPYLQFVNAKNLWEMLGALEHESEADGMLTRMIMDGMEECIADHAETAKQDEKSAKSVNDVADKARELAEELGRKVTIEELMQETGFTRNAIQRALVFSGGKIEDIDSDPK